MINYFEMASRLRYLSSIINDHELKHWLSQFFESSQESEHHYNEEVKEVIEDVVANNNDFLIPENDSSEIDKPLIAYLTTASGILGSQWRFHQYDRGFFPSIPHGHLLTNKKVKLDSYRGFTFDTSANNKPLTREKRRFIISLWNSSKFRTFAINHINFYILNFPNHNWRVKNRTRIPRRKP